MANSYYDPADLRKFGNITEWSEELGTKFFDYYGKVFEEGALSAREKSLIALAVAHVVKCPYCIDAYTKDGLQRGITKEEMMEAVHAGAAIESGASNDDISMLLPQAYQYSAVVTMNAQAIQHFLKLRTKPDAHWDIRNLANEIYANLPEEHKYLFEEYVK